MCSVSGEAGDRLRFVVQEHRCGEQVHWDLMLQKPRRLDPEGKLATWRLSKLPRAEMTSLSAVRIFDHRPAFLQYEGVLREGRGRVQIVQAGTYALLDCRREIWTVEFFGSSLSGRYELLRVGGPDGWELRKVTGGSG